MTAQEVMTPFVEVASVGDTDKVLLQAVQSDGTVVPGRILLPALRAYLTKSIAVGVTDGGTLTIGGSDTGVQVEGVTPQLRRGTYGIEVSTDKGATWQTVCLYADLAVDVWLTQEEYDALVEAEAVDANITYNIYE